MHTHPKHRTNSFITSSKFRINMQGEAHSQLSSFGPTALRMLYVNYRIPIIKWLVKNYTMDISEATELAQSAFAVFIEKAANGSLPDFQTATNTKSYLFAIAKNKVRERQRQLRKTAPLTEGHLGIAEDEHTAFDEEKKQQIQLASRAFRKLGNKCQELLKLAIVFKLSMHEIADQLQYQNTNTAKTQKYKCLIRLRKLYQQSPS